jgi:DNA-binding MarR family transcriptional regulator
VPTQAKLFSSLALRVARGITRLERDQICCGTLTLQQFQTLRAVDEAGAVTTSALAEALRVDLSTISRNLTLLERQGLLKRRRDPSDARVVSIALTNRGAAALQNLRCDERLVYAEVLGRIPKHKRGAVLEALETLAGALGEMPATAPDAKCCPDAAPGACPPKKARRRA